MIFSNKKQKSQQGFTLFIAVIITSIVILLGVTIAGIMQRDTLITASSRASTQAFYAADTALECALKWDNRGENQFASSSDTIECAGDDSVSVSDSCPGDCDFYFELDDEGDANVCAEVSIEKEPTGNGGYLQVQATGGDEVYDINVGGVPYRVHEFHGDGILDVIVGGDVEYLIIGGGGGGGSNDAGGGGAGGMIEGSGEVEVGSESVVVGQGGEGGTPAGGGGEEGNPGEDSSFLGQVAYGGGFGGTNSDPGGDGGSGGGGGDGGEPGGSGVAGQGNDGGWGNNNGGGGGGAGEPGEEGTPDGDADGGDGLQSSITGTPTYYAGGGAGSDSNDAYSLEGGLGGGGDGDCCNGGDGEPNTGGGGGGASYNATNGGDGGSGIVIIRYALANPDDSDAPANTLIESRGRNTCQPSSRQVERALRSFY